MGNADRVNVEGPHCEGDQAGEAGDGHADQRVVAQRDGQRNDDGHEGNDLLRPAEDAAYEHEDERDDGDNQLTAHPV